MSVIDGVLSKVVPPEPLIIFAQGWPSFLISALAMDLPIAGAFFPASFHCYFDKTKSGDLTWYEPDDFKPSEYKGIVLASGSMEFIHHVHRRCKPTSAVFCVERRLRGLHFRQIQHFHSEAKRDLISMGYSPFVAQHADFGGATSAAHVLAFSPSLLGDTGLCMSSMESPRSIAHYLNAATRGSFGLWIDSPPDEPSLRSDKPLWLDKSLLVYTLKKGDLAVLKSARKRCSNVLRPEGILPIFSPGALIACPSVFGPPNTRCLRPISLPEALRIFSIPSFMDEAILGRAAPGLVKSHLPFEDAISPDIVASLFRQLWEIRDGGVEVFVWKSEVSDPQLLSPSDDLKVDGEGQVEAQVEQEVVEVEGWSAESGTMTIVVENDFPSKSDHVAPVNEEEDATVVTSNLSGKKTEGADVEEHAGDREECLSDLPVASMGFEPVTAAPSSTLLPSYAAPQESLDSASKDLKVSKAVKPDEAP
eukprot:scaffold9792_cov129-Skeletonema_dohrnii-CCMP3373.AAC.2